MIERLFTFPVRHPLIVIAILFATTLVTTFGFGALRIDTRYDSLIDSSDPETQYYEQAVGKFQSDYIALVYLEAGDLFTQKRLQQVEALTLALAKLDRVQDVRGLFTAGHVEDADGVLDVRPVIETTPESEAGIAQALERARRNPFVPRNLLNGTATATAISVVFKDSWNDDVFAEQTFDKIEALLTPLRAEFRAAFQLGPPRVMMAGRNAVLHDMIYIGLFSVAVLVGTLALFLNTRIAILLPIMTAGVSLYWTLGLMGLLGIPIAMMAAALPAMVVVVGSAEDTHMLAAYLDGLHDGETTRAGGVAFMARRIGTACVLTAATTAAGFGISGITVIEMMRNSAIALALGMTLNFFATALIVPLILSRFGPLKIATPRAKWSAPRFVEAFTERALAFSIRQGRNVAIGAIATTVVCLWVGFSLEPNTDPLSLLGKKDPLRQDIEIWHARMGGSQVFNIVVEGKSPGAFRDPEMLFRLMQIEKTIVESGRFDTALSVADEIAFVNREINGGGSEMYRVPADRNLIEQYLLLFSRSDLENFLTPDYRSANIVVRHETFNSAKLKANLAAIEERMNAIAGPELTVHVTGKPILLNRSAEMLVYGNIVSLFLLILVVAASIGFAYRSLRLGLIVLIPNVLPASGVFLAMAVFGIALDPGTSLAADVALGIAVDDTIHFMNAFRRGLLVSPDTGTAATLAVMDQALPVTAVTLALTACFGSLVLSSFAAAANFGLLCAASIALSQPCELIITPSLLRLFGAGNRFAPAGPPIPKPNGRRE